MRTAPRRIWTRYSTRTGLRLHILIVFIIGYLRRLDNIDILIVIGILCCLSFFVGVVYVPVSGHITGHNAPKG